MIFKNLFSRLKNIPYIPRILLNDGGIWEYNENMLFMLLQSMMQGKAHTSIRFPASRWRAEPIYACRTRSRAKSFIAHLCPCTRNGIGWVSVLESRYLIF